MRAFTLVYYDEADPKGKTFNLLFSAHSSPFLWLWNPKPQVVKWVVSVRFPGSALEVQSLFIWRELRVDLWLLGDLSWGRLGFWFRCLLDANLLWCSGHVLLGEDPGLVGVIIPSIHHHLSKVGSCRQQVKERIPDSALPSDTLQPFLGNPELFRPTRIGRDWMELDGWMQC